MIASLFVKIPNTNCRLFMRYFKKVMK